MKITKLGHCCLLIEDQGKRILTDPGIFTIETQSKIRRLDAVLITHEHKDHFHIESVREIVFHNPRAQIITNKAVGTLLKKEDITYTVLNDGETVEVGSVTIKSLESPHAEIYSTMPRVLNTGFLVSGRLFYPGDAFIDPKAEVEILALPIAGPWMKQSEAIDYAIALQPSDVFPVHDGILKNSALFHPQIHTLLAENHIIFQSMIEGDTLEF